MGFGASNIGVEKLAFRPAILKSLQAFYNQTTGGALDLQMQTKNACMKTFLLVLLTGILAIPGLAQSGAAGIRFEENTTWQQVLAKAKKENKYVFVDAYTTWCGPCKYMAKNIFTQPDVGEFFNARFINLKVQLDTTRNDNEEVKRWYKDAHNIMVNYSVRVFPTYLFIAPDGRLVHRAVGASQGPAFIAKAKNALDPEKQYYTLKALYDKGDRTPGMLKNLCLAAQEAYDMDMVAVYSDAYFATQSNLLTEENIRLLTQFTSSTVDTGFVLMVKHAERFNQVMGQGYAEKTTRMLVLQEELWPAMRAGAAVDWEGMRKRVERRYPERKDIVPYGQLFYYQQTGDWEKFPTAAVAFMKEYGNTLDAGDLNSMAWAIFQHCEDMNCIREAIQWSKKAATSSQLAAYYDTYAGLLYKSGQKDEALQVQEQAITLAKTSGTDIVDDLEARLAQMKKGEKTW